MNEYLKRIHDMLKDDEKSEATASSAQFREALLSISRGVAGLKNGQIDIMEFPEARELFGNNLQEFSFKLDRLITKLDRFF